MIRRKLQKVEPTCGELFNKELIRVFLIAIPPAIKTLIPHQVRDSPTEVFRTVCELLEKNPQYKLRNVDIRKETRRPINAIRENTQTEIAARADTSKLQGAVPKKYGPPKSGPEP